MKPSVEQKVADENPHRRVCRALRYTNALCTCGANARRNVILARMATEEGYVYLDRQRKHS